ncbi:MAG TPA: cytochrome b [Steroidobacteraceae bacterium]|nr:cytochrome b [Steroidobacteraceae bacterium]
MTIRNTTVRWGHVSQFLHWLIVVLLIVQVTVASMAEDLPPVKKIGPLAWHKSIGITIMALAVLRLLWRWANPTPLLPGTLKPYERVLASFTHATLYILLFAMPLSGWMMSSARGFPVAWFGFFPKSWFGSVQLPDLVPKNKSLYDVMLTTHQTLQWALYTVVFLHVAAALKHHFLLKDDVLRRMLPFTKNR